MLLQIRKHSAFPAAETPRVALRAPGTPVLLRAELPAEAPQPVWLVKGLSLHPPGGPRRAWGALWPRHVLRGLPPPAGAGKTQNHHPDRRENRRGRPGSGVPTGPPGTWGGEKSESPLSSGKVLSSAAQGRAKGHCGALLLHSIELRPHEACSCPLASK